MKLLTNTLWLPATLILGACSVVDTDSFRLPDMSIVAPRTTATLREKPLQPITNEDLIGTDGSCAGVQLGPDPNVPGNQSQPDVPLIPSGIALEMAECDVVRRGGARRWLRGCGAGGSGARSTDVRRPAAKW